LKLSTATVDVLRWCGKVNRGLSIAAGSRIASINRGRSAVLEANVGEVFPCDWTIADLREVLPYLHEGTEISFDVAEVVQIRRSARASLQLANKPETPCGRPPQRKDGYQFDETFFLHADDVFELNELIKRKRKGRPLVVLESANPDRVLRIHYDPLGMDSPQDADLSRTRARWHTITPSPPTILGSQWSVQIRADNLQLAEGSYSVSFTRSGRSRFSWLSGDVALYVAIEESRSSVDGTCLSDFNEPVVIPG
jgi:hypothetical protein